MVGPGFGTISELGGYPDRIETWKFSVPPRGAVLCQAKGREAIQPAEASLGLLGPGDFDTCPEFS